MSPLWQWVKANPDEAARKIRELGRENLTLQADKNRLVKIITDLVAVSSCAMREANRDGADWNIQSELAEARDAIDTARKEQRERKIKQMTDAASLDIGHSCLSGDKWMRDDPI